jgi:hypothetical protein
MTCVACGNSDHLPVTVCKWNIPTPAAAMTTYMPLHPTCEPCSFTNTPTPLFTHLISKSTTPNQTNLVPVQLWFPYHPYCRIPTAQPFPASYALKLTQIKILSLSESQNPILLSCSNTTPSNAPSSAQIVTKLRCPQKPARHPAAKSGTHPKNNLQSLTAH